MYMYVGIIISESLFQNVTPHAHFWQKAHVQKIDGSMVLRRDNDFVVEHRVIIVETKLINI